jgi:hypothetical protein
MLLKLPVDISTFSLLRKENYLYIDKTKFAHDLITGGRRFFLSRPRRFGKSLFVSTLEEILLGHRSLFKGLWIAKSRYKWPKHGVVTLDLSGLAKENAESFRDDLCSHLKRCAKDHGIAILGSQKKPEPVLWELIRALHDRFGRVAVLVDEYDAPILRNLRTPPQAEGIRDAIRDFFLALKSLDRYVDFVFITGVSAFAKAGIFSGMNNLQSLSLESAFGDICGYTDEEVDRKLGPYLKAWSKSSKVSFQSLREKIRQWYDGYHFGDQTPAIYNPFSLMKLLQVKRFENFWFDSGTPSFLIDEIKKEQRRSECEIIDLEKMQGSQDLLQSFEINKTPLPALLFQTGYLTIASYDPQTRNYTLKCPNVEVQTTLYKHLLTLRSILRAKDASTSSSSFPMSSISSRSN